MKPGCQEWEEASVELGNALDDWLWGKLIDLYGHEPKNAEDLLSMLNSGPEEITKEWDKMWIFNA